MAATHVPLTKQTLFHDGFLEDPYPTYRRFLEAGRIHKLDWGGRNLWTVFCYDDCLAALKDQRLSARRMAAVLASLPEEERAQFFKLQHVMGLWLLFMDAPEHSRLRKLMNKGFSPAAIELLRPQVEAIVDRMLNLMGNTSEVDLMPAIAHPLPVSVIAELLGIPDTMQTQLTEWSDAIATFIGNPMRTVQQTAAAQEAITSLTSCFRQIVAERRLHKRDDLISSCSKSRPTERHSLRTSFTRSASCFSSAVMKPREI
jgi:cytochrome P450